MTSADQALPDPLEYVPCNLCGEDDADIVYPCTRMGTVVIGADEFQSSGDEPLADAMVRCRRCGLEYVTPRLNPAIVLEGYINAIDETFVSQAKGREITFARCLDIVAKHWGKAPGRILDVGTANGSFLKVARDAGWQVSGCEPNEWMERWCREHYDIDIVSGTIFDGRYGNNEFDIVTLWDVLEHTADPAAVLKECRRILKPGGLLFVNYPDIGAWISRTMGRKWVFLLSVHYYYFTRKTIRKILDKTGFEVKAIQPHFQTLELDYILFRASAYVAVIAKPLRSLCRAIGLGRWYVPYWVGQTLAVASKRDSRQGARQD